MNGNRQSFRRMILLVFKKPLKIKIKFPTCSMKQAVVNNDESVENSAHAHGIFTPSCSELVWVLANKISNTATAPLHGTQHRKGVARKKKNCEWKNPDAETTTVSIFHNIVDMIFFYSKLKNPIKNSVLCASVFLLGILSF